MFEFINMDKQRIPLNVLKDEIQKLFNDQINNNGWLIKIKINVYHI